MMVNKSYRIVLATAALPSSWGLSTLSKIVGFAIVLQGTPVLGVRIGTRSFFPFGANKIQFECYTTNQQHYCAAESNSEIDDKKAKEAFEKEDKTTSVKFDLKEDSPVAQGQYSFFRNYKSDDKEQQKYLNVFMEHKTKYWKNYVKIYPFLKVEPKSTDDENPTGDKKSGPTENTTPDDHAVDTKEAERIANAKKEAERIANANKEAERIARDERIKRMNKFNPAFRGT